MGLGEDLRALAGLVEKLDTHGIDVVDATPTDADEDALIADLRIRVPRADHQPVTAPGVESSLARPGIEPQVAAARDATGPARNEPSAGSDDVAQSADTEDPAPAGSADDGVPAASPDDATPPDSAADASGGDDANGADERVTCTHESCSETFDSEHGMRIHRSKTHVHGGADRNTEQLARVYEQHDSFPAMRDALDADVSSQTVRRWMMDAGIHETDAGQRDDPTAADATDASTAAPDSDADTTNPSEADASEADTDQRIEEDPDRVPDVDQGLPDAVAVADLRAAVESAATLYDVQQQLDVDRETARELLAEYDLLELVHGRVADRPRREELKDEIDDRLRTNTTQADSPSD